MPVPGGDKPCYRRLVEAGTRFVTQAGYKSNQWDTHGDDDNLGQDLVGHVARHVR